ncbi:MAG: glycosyltransferase [Butyrivibrio sp.]|jgi:glycosyltransferase involved in cell wall biosynthesis|nr:glycosyltransferase [Butyrivibrio sp.]
MISSSIKVSVIMPSLNVVEYIDECMQSVLAQTLNDIEILAIDAGSTDGTWEKLQEYSQRDDRIKLIRSDIKSYGYQVNLGIKTARGKYIGIVETDDYIDSDMYSCLYTIAEENDVDMIKADFDSFYVSKNGEKILSRSYLFDNDKKDNYNKCIDPRMISYLYVYDCFIWKGLYNREFLLNNKIFLNESKGAAYQDVGFSHLVHACCQKAYYSDRSFYRYRKDREGSSINSDKGLIYDKDEFERLINDKDISSRLVCREALYLHIKVVYINELKRALRANAYNIYDDNIKPYYEWFRNMFLPIVGENELCRNIHFHEIAQAVYDIDGFVNELKKSDEIQEKIRGYYIDRLSGKDVVVFGAGKKGKSMISYLRQSTVDITVSAVCDNNKKIWGTDCNGYTVLSPMECIEQNTDNAFIVANKYHKFEIVAQLLEAGIPTDRILESI